MLDWYTRYKKLPYLELLLITNLLDHFRSDGGADFAGACVRVKCAVSCVLPTLTDDDGEEDDQLQQPGPAHLGHVQRASRWLDVLVQASRSRTTVPRLPAYGKRGKSNAGVSSLHDGRERDCRDCLLVPSIKACKEEREEEAVVVTGSVEGEKGNKGCRGRCRKQRWRSVGSG